MEQLLLAFSKMESMVTVGAPVLPNMKFQYYVIQKCGRVWLHGYRLAPIEIGSWMMLADRSIKSKGHLIVSF